VSASGKALTACTPEGGFDAERAATFAMEWPRSSGKSSAKMPEFPEIDRAEWFEVDVARQKPLRGHGVFLDRLLAAIAAGDTGPRHACRQARARSVSLSLRTSPCYEDAGRAGSTPSRLCRAVRVV